MAGRLALLATALAVLALTGCERVPADTATQKIVPACEGVPALSFDSGIADPENFLRGGYEERVRGAQLQLDHAHSDHSVSVVILPSLNGRTIEATTTCIANMWESEGIITTNDIVILLATKDRQVRIATGADARDDLPDAEAAKIIKKMTSIFAADGPAAGNISEGLGAGIDAINEHLKDRP